MQFLSCITRNASRSLKTAANHIAKGSVIEYKNRHFFVSRIDSHWTGRGSAAMKFDLKDVVNGQKLTERIRPTEYFEVVTVKERNYRYLYSDGNTLHLINAETLDEIEIDSDKVDGGEKSIKLLDDDMNLTVAFLETEEGERAISVRLPHMYAYEVVSNTPNIGSSSKGPAQKTVEIKGGIHVQVPEFVNVTIIED
ncbi:10252_t:CDS:2 [Acaulospora morrowiae]|uniref:10252_t:CDS:1 n=1 Tax=Acaulospora morrowiae TaxID=94023 RepID=A0A9N8VJG9_9GLOM|nr:10252_t:CDS:2 [Acaulospora morrowiae]